MCRRRRLRGAAVAVRRSAPVKRARGWNRHVSHTRRPAGASRAGVASQSAHEPRYRPAAPRFGRAAVIAAYRPRSAPMRVRRVKRRQPPNGRKHWRFCACIALRQGCLIRKRSQVRVLDRPLLARIVRARGRIVMSRGAYACAATRLQPEAAAEGGGIVSAGLVVLAGLLVLAGGPVVTIQAARRESMDRAAAGLDGVPHRTPPPTAIVG